MYIGSKDQRRQAEINRRRAAISLLQQQIDLFDGDFEDLNHVSEPVDSSDHLNAMPVVDHNL